MYTPSSNNCLTAKLPKGVLAVTSFGQSGVRRMIQNDMEPLTMAVCDAPLRGKSYFLTSAFAHSTNRLVDSFNGGMVEGIINLTLVGLFLYSSLASSLDR